MFELDDGTEIEISDNKELAETLQKILDKSSDQEVIALYHSYGMQTLYTKTELLEKYRDLPEELRSMAPEVEGDYFVIDEGKKRIISYQQDWLLGELKNVMYFEVANGYFTPKIRAALAAYYKSSSH